MLVNLLRNYLPAMYFKSILFLKYIYIFLPSTSTCLVSKGIGERRSCIISVAGTRLAFALD